MTDSITAEQWAKIHAELYGSDLDTNTQLEKYMAIADYLAEKGVWVAFNVNTKIYDASLMDYHDNPCDEELFFIMEEVSHKNINYCRALAVLALIGERQ